MKNKKLKAGVIAAIGSAIVAGSGNAQTQGIGQDIQKRGVADSINLEKRLKELAALPPREVFSMTTCYASVTINQKGEYTCPYCQNEINDRWNTHIIYNLKNIENVFNEIKAEGYDVVLDKTEYCPKCSKDESIEYPAPVFKLRFSEKSKYYEVKTGFVSDYLCLLAFLQDKRLYQDRDDEEYLPERIHVIRHMTGLGKDLKIKK